MRKDPIKEIIELAQHTTMEDLTRLAAVSAVSFNDYPHNDLFSSLVMYCHDIINGLLSIRNGDQTKYDATVLVDIEAILDKIYDDFFDRFRDDIKARMISRGYAKDEVDAYIEQERTTCRDALCNALEGHYLGKYQGTEPYKPIIDLPVVMWAMAEGNFQRRLELFKDIFMFSKTQIGATQCH